MLDDAAAMRELERKYGPDYRFSPSQLETYIACPFQFFSKYVLDLEPVEEKDELDEDLTERGSRLHDILENFETLLKQARSGPGPGADRRDPGRAGPRAGAWPSPRTWTRGSGRSSGNA